MEIKTTADFKVLCSEIDLLQANIDLLQAKKDRLEKTRSDLFSMYVYHVTLEEAYLLLKEKKVSYGGTNNHDVWANKSFEGCLRTASSRKNRDNALIKDDSLHFGSGTGYEVYPRMCNDNYNQSYTLLPEDHKYFITSEKYLGEKHLINKKVL